MSRYVKSFEDTETFLTDVLWYKILSLVEPGIPGLIRYHKIDYFRQSISMDKYDMDVFYYVQKYDVIRKNTDIIVKNILHTLCAIHDVGICNNDLKPDNFVINRKDKKMAIIDFETLRFKGDQKRDEVTTKLYRSNDTVYNEALDIFSLGVTLTVIHDPKTIDTLLDEQHIEYTKLCDNVEPESTKDLISEMLNDDPELRPTCREILNRMFKISPAQFKFPEASIVENVSNEFLSSLKEEIDDFCDTRAIKGKFNIWNALSYTYKPESVNEQKVRLQAYVLLFMNTILHHGYNKIDIKDLINHSKLRCTKREFVTTFSQLVKEKAVLILLVRNINTT